MLIVGATQEVAGTTLLGKGSRPPTSVPLLEV